MTDATRQVIVAAFENFDKWASYGTVFALMTQRKCTLRDIQEIAAEVAQISPEVIAMRRRDLLAMRGPNKSTATRWGTDFICEWRARV